MSIVTLGIFLICAIVTGLVARKVWKEFTLAEINEQVDDLAVVEQELAIVNKAKKKYSDIETKKETVKSFKKEKK